MKKEFQPIKDMKDKRLWVIIFISTILASFLIFVTYKSNNIKLVDFIIYAIVSFIFCITTAFSEFYLRNIKKMRKLYLNLLILIWDIIPGISLSYMIKLDKFLEIYNILTAYILIVILQFIINRSDKK